MFVSTVGFHDYLSGVALKQMVELCMDGVASRLGRTEFVDCSDSVSSRPVCHASTFIYL